MRKNFAIVLKDNKIDIPKEYSRLYDLFNCDYKEGVSARKCIDYKFSSFWFRGTDLQLDEFDETHEFYFTDQPEDIDIDYLVSFCEYIYNLLICYMASSMDSAYFDLNAQFILNQVDHVIDKIGYMKEEENKLTIFVEKSPAAISVAEILPEPQSYKVITYNHHSMKGDLEGKKAIILQLANLLEPKRKQLSCIDSTLENDLFYLFNNLNLRHNNIALLEKTNYKKYVSEMTNSELEEWYDEIYQMCLLAFLEIDNIDRKKKFSMLKTQIDKM